VYDNYEKMLEILDEWLHVTFHDPFCMWSIHKDCINPLYRILHICGPLYYPVLTACVTKK